MRVGFKMWLEEEQRSVFGEGRYRLLKTVERAGSISAAARVLGISYRSAWTHLDRVERSLHVRLLERRRGGSGGGATALTPQAKRLLSLYEDYFREFDALAGTCTRDLEARVTNLMRSEGGAPGAGPSS
jgi:molybdate transport system regulatory protein